MTGEIVKHKWELESLFHPEIKHWYDMYWHVYSLLGKKLYDNFYKWY
jgi:hypothetical protein